MNKEEINSAVGLLFLLCIGFLIFGVFGAFGEAAQSIIISGFIILSFLMIGIILYKTIIK